MVVLLVLVYLVRSQVVDLLFEDTDGGFGVGEVLLKLLLFADYFA